MNLLSELVGLQVIHTNFGQGVVVRVDAREAPNEPLVWVRFSRDDKPERRFGLSALREEQYFTGLILPDGCRGSGPSSQEGQQTQSSSSSVRANGERKKAIREVCRTRCIELLAHFTHVNNLRDILETGLLSRQTLEKRPMAKQPNFNDARRLDRFKQAICLSISFPNYKMFYSYSRDNQAEWVVLLIDASVMWELDCAFFEDNAASSRVTGTPLAERKQTNALKNMFADCGPTRREDLDIPANWPTNPQAEVLVFEPIHPKYIKEVHFHTKGARRDWVQGNLDVAPQRTYAGSKYFSPRKDWRAWTASRQDTDLNSLEEEEILF